MALVSLSMQTGYPIFSFNTSAKGRSEKLNMLKLYPDSGFTLPEMLMQMFIIFLSLISVPFMKFRMSAHSSSKASCVFSNLYGMFILISTISPLKLISPMFMANFLMSTPMKYPDSGLSPYRLGWRPLLVSSFP